MDGQSANFNVPPTVVLDASFNVRQHLEKMREWEDEWKRQNSLLNQRVNNLDVHNPIDIQKSTEIAGMKRRLLLKLVDQAIEVSPDVIAQVGYKNLRQHLVAQFAGLSDKDRLLWLKNFLFILTPDLQQLGMKIANIRDYRSMGQQRNFLLGGQSGMGKTTFLNWFAFHNTPQVEGQRNHIPIVMIDAPVDNKSSRSLLRRLASGCGLIYSPKATEEDLLQQVVLLIMKCGVELVIVDEIQHIERPEIRRRLLEISNMSPGIPIVCASCHPELWTEGDPEVKGRWNDSFYLKQYTGERLSELLAFIQLLLPFPKDSSLPLLEIKTSNSSKPEEGPARLIEKWTDGIFRNIMILIVDASRNAIEKGESNLSPRLLAEAWTRIEHKKVTDFLQALKIDDSK